MLLEDQNDSKAAAEGNYEAQRLKYNGQDEPSLRGSETYRKEPDNNVPMDSIKLDMAVTESQMDPRNHKDANDYVQDRGARDVGSRNQSRNDRANTKVKKEHEEEEQAKQKGKEEGEEERLADVDKTQQEDKKLKEQDKEERLETPRKPISEMTTEEKQLEGKKTKLIACVVCKGIWWWRQ